MVIQSMLPTEKIRVTADPRYQDALASTPAIPSEAILTNSHIEFDFARWSAIGVIQ
jgi:hypothetical protein